MNKRQYFLLPAIGVVLMGSYLLHFFVLLFNKLGRILTKQKITIEIEKGMEDFLGQRSYKPPTNQIPQCCHYLTISEISTIRTHYINHRVK